MQPANIPEELSSVLAPEVRAMLTESPDSQCAIDCMRAISAACAFIDACPDMLPANRQQVYAMTARQCAVFYFG